MKYKRNKPSEYSSASKGFIARYNWLRRTLLSGIRINCTEIAEHMGCTPKTAQRYINRLRRDGYDIIFDASANAFLIVPGSKTPEPVIRQSDLYIVLRQAYAWARKNHKDAPWLPAVAKILKVK